MFTRTPIDDLDQTALHLGCAVRCVGNALLHVWRAIEAFWRSWLCRFLLLLSLGCTLIMLFTGCMLRGPRVSIPDNGILAGGQATAPKNNGTPATVNSSGEETRMEVPVGSTVTETTIEATPAIPATPDTPAVPATPRTVVREVHLSAPTAIVQKAQHVQTSTGTIDTAVALHRIDVQDRSKLLWIALACGIGGLIVRSTFPAWPGISNGLLAGAAIAFVAWKVSALPQWIFLVPIGIMGAKALGYKRAEWDKDGDGIPDLLEKKPADLPQGKSP